MDGTAMSMTRQRGVTLVTAMVFVAVVSVLSITSMRSSRIGIRMSQNEEARYSAIETAQGMTEIVAGNPALTPVVGGTGYSVCTIGVSNCNSNNLQLPAGTLDGHVAAGDLTARVERMSPPEKPPPRLTESSLDKFSAATFQITATFDRTDDGMGRARISEGVLVLVPKS